MAGDGNTGSRQFFLRPGHTMIRIPYGAFVAEHKKLVNLLESGSKAARMKEAKDQRMELMDATKRVMKEKK
jgi:hypothetical protein